MGISKVLFGTDCVMHPVYHMNRPIAIQFVHINNSRNNFVPNQIKNGKTGQVGSSNFYYILCMSPLGPNSLCMYLI